MKLEPGDYLLKIDGNDTRVDYSFKLSSLSEAEELILGESTTGSFGAGKKTNLYKFDAVAGDRFFFDYQAISGSRYAYNTQWRLIDPNGEEVFDQRFRTDAKNITVSQTGTYTLLLEHDVIDSFNNSSETVDYRFQIEKIKPTQELTLGETITSRLSTDSYSFTLDKKSQLYFDSLTNNSKFSWSIVDAEGTEYYSRTFTRSDGRYVDNPVLDLPMGEYKIKIDGDSITTDYSFRLLDLAGAEELPIGTTVEKDFLPPNKTDMYRFAGNAGERYFFDYQSLTGINGYSGGWNYWSLVDPQGNIVFDQSITNDAQDVTLPETGDYTLLIEGYIAATSNNNNAEYKFQINPIAADLAPTSFTAPNTVTWGEEFELSWEIGNQGSLTSTGWSERVYLSKDATLDDDDIVLATFDDADAITLAQDESEPRSQTIEIDTLKIDDTTDWHLLVAVEGNLRDADTSNDVVAAPIELLPPSFADLEVVEVTAPATAESGSQIEISWQVNNVGNLATNVNSWVDRVYFSQDEILNFRDTSTSIIHRGTLAVGDSYSENATLTVPEEITGNYHVFVRTDYNNSVFEFVSNDNNIKKSDNLVNVTLRPTADLKVTEVTTTGVTQPGGTIVVNWSATNQGNFVAGGNWLDSVYLTGDGTLNNAIKLTDVTRNEDLAAGATYQGTAEIVLPDDIADGNYQIIVVADSSNRVIERNQENNNTYIDSEFLTFTHPDIVVDDLTAPATAVSGDTISIIYQVENQGTGATFGGWSDRLYLSEDEIFDPEEDRQLTDYEHSLLEVDGTHGVSLDVEMPVDVSGDYHLLLVSDADNEIKELAGEGNNLATSPIAIELAPYADLEVSNVTAPAQTIDDPARVEIGWTVSNTGTGDGITSTWSDRIIASRDEIVGNGDDIVLEEFEYSSGLAAGASYQRSEEILLPPAFTGRYHLYVQSDSAAVVFENGLKDNNSVKADDFFDVMPIPYADLQIEEIAPQGEAKSGQPLTVEWTVSNQGIGITNDSEWIDELFLATDPAGENIVEDLGEFYRAGRLGVKDSYTRTTAVTLPNGITGDYYLVAKTEGPFEFIYDDNNTTISDVFNISYTPTPDLVVTDILAPNGIVAGQKIDLSWTAQNQGIGDAVGRWQDKIYLQEVGNPDGELIALATYNYDRTLESGKSYTRQEKITIPPELQGVYRVVVDTNPGTKGLYEGDNTDNNRLIDGDNLEITLPPRPDLQVSSVVAPDTVSAGSRVEVDFTIINQGTAATKTAKWQDRIYLSLDNEISSDDLVISTLDNGSALAPNASYLSQSESIIIPERFRGNAYLIVEADATKKVNELPQEKNNVKYKEITVLFDETSGQPADLVTSNVVAPRQAFEGSTVEVRYTVTNSGINTTNTNRWQDTIWLTKDKDRPSAANRTEGKVEDILLKTVTRRGELAVGESYEEVVEVTLPDKLTGEWHITPWSDTYDAVLEDTLDVNNNPDDPNELDNNNYKARPLTLLLTPPPDLVVSEIVAPVTATAEEKFEFSWTVTNQGAGETTDEGWLDKVYLTDAPTLAESTTKLELGEFSHSGSLKADESYTQTAQIDLSPAAVGQYIVVETNAKDRRGQRQAWEGPYTNNNADYADSDIATPAADLKITSIIAPETSDSGETAPLSWTVTNQGADMWSGTKYWYDEVWVSPDPNFIKGRATPVGRFIHSPETSLKTGDSYTQEQNITLPPGIDGEYYFYVTTDYSLESELSKDYSASLDIPRSGTNEDSWESYEVRGFEDPSNNVEQVAFDAVYKEADLKITNLNVDNPNPTSGATVPLSWTVENIGTRTTRTNYWEDRVYLSTDATLDFNDELLTSYIREAETGLGIGESYDVNLNVQLPENIDGDYHLLVFTDSNIHDGSEPYNLKSGGPEQKEIYYEVGLDENLARVPEFRDEDNNITAIPLDVTQRDLADLQVTEVVVPPRATVGQSFELTYTVTNEGTGDTTAAESRWNEMVYLSRDRFLDTRSDIYLPVRDTFNTQTVHTGGLNSAESYSVSETFDLPHNLEGPYYVFVVTDPKRPGINDRVFEGDRELNNNLTSTQPLSLDFPPPADLQVGEIKIPDNPISGQEVELEWSVTNHGPNEAGGEWSDAVYLSSDATWDISDRPLGKFERSDDLDPLAPGESYTGKLNTTLPPAAPGQYRLIVRPDIFNQVYEAENEGNNFTTSAEALSLTVAKLNLGVAEATTLNTGQSRLYRIEVGAGETLRVKVDSQSDRAANEVFIKQGTIPTGTDYDYAYSGGLAADQEVIVPATEPGTYFVLVKGYAQPSRDTATTILAEALPFGVTDVSADTGGDGRYVTVDITGAKFDENAVVKFLRPGIAEYFPVEYEVLNATKIRATFDFTDAPHGLYDVKVINPDGAEAVLPYRYLIERAIEPDVTVGLGGKRVLGLGETGTYGVSFQNLANIDNPYIHFQYGVPELKENSYLYGQFNEYSKIQSGIEELPFVEFSTNLRGQAPELDGDLAELPWASLKSDLNIDGEILAPGFVYDLPNASAAGLSFNAAVYPGFNDLLRYHDDALSDEEREEDSEIAFQFHIQASATALSREEFIELQTNSALKLRESILNDDTASDTLQLLAADEATWTSSYLAALEEAGLLRQSGEAAPIRENPLVISLMATLGTGLLVGAGGESIITDGNLLGFFAQLRSWYGHDENLVGSEGLPDPTTLDLGAAKTTHYQGFDIYVPYGRQALDLPPGIAVPDPNFTGFLGGEGENSALVNLVGPVGSFESNFLPIGQDLPYTIQFANDPNASSSVGEVRIVSQLDPNLDPRTFKLGDLQLGDIQVNIPDNRGAFDGEFDFTASKGFILRVSAGLDPISNTATWLLQAIDPETGELITNPDLGLLPPNDAAGAGSGMVGYTVQPVADVATGTQISTQARVLYNNAPPLDTETVNYVVDGAAPTTTVTVEALAGEDNDYLVKWDATDEEDGSGVRHVTVYVAEDGGDFTIWQQQTTDTVAVYQGEAGKSYEFLALATDNAGNREIPNLGVNLPDDGSGSNLGALPDVGRTTEPTPLPAKPPNPNFKINPLFTAAKQDVPNTTNTTNPSEFDSVLRPFKATAFTTGVQSSHGEIAPLAIAELADDTFLISGGKNRGSLYKVDRIGGAAGNPFVELTHPIFEMEVDERGFIWATTGGGPLLQLDSATGEIIREHGEGITHW